MKKVLTLLLLLMGTCAYGSTVTHYVYYPKRITMTDSTVVHTKYGKRYAVTGYEGGDVSTYVSDPVRNIKAPDRIIYKPLDINMVQVRIEEK